jgi:hypothetical protein
MTVYLYNLAFSLLTSDTAVGRFQQYDSSIRNPTIASQSAAWFTYNQTGTPNNLGDYYQPVLSQLDPSQWRFYDSDVDSLTMKPGDYLMMRIFCTDANVANYNGRVTGVFGRGTSAVSGPGAGDLQSPLVMSTPTQPSTYPRAVIDVDGSTASNWPLPITGPLTPDGSWVNWLGMVHVAPANAANDYTFNVGASVYNGTQLYTFGKDPRMQVGAGMKRGRRKTAA